jgi:mono/diheme cytochrome c family protein
MPESLVERSAKARAKSEGGSVDDVLLEWAKEEGLDVAGGGQASTAPEPSSDLPAVDQPEDIEELVDASDVEPAPKVDIPSPSEPEAIEEPEPEVPASPRSRYPAWLAAVLIIVPLMAVLYLVVVPNQPTCGSAGQLAIDPATGNAVGCDGGEYGVGAVSNLSAGAAVYEAACAVCHGANGGGGAGPAMAGGAVLVAFPDTACESQIEWITLGSADWPDATYGANNTPVAGGMPGFEGQLTELEIAQVTLYERVEFGGLEVETAETACGLGAEEG